MATTSPWNIPLFDRDSPFTPTATPFNAISNALNTALTSASFGFYLQWATKAEMDLVPGTRFGQHASVYGDTAAKNGDYVWNGSTWVRDGVVVANISTFGGGTTPLTGPHTPRLRLSNGVVTVFGAVTSTDFNDLFTAPAAFQPPTTTTRFIGTAITRASGAGGGVFGVSMTAGLAKSEGPNGYSVGTQTAGIVSITGLTWSMD